MDVKSLSDRDLKEQLVKHGVLPGPILPTTRFVYEKKLQQLLDQGPPVPRERQNGNGDMDRYSDSDEEDPRDSTAEQRREVTFTGVPNNASIFNHSKMDQRPPMGHTGGHQKMLGSSSRNNYNVKAGDLLQMDHTAEQYSPSTYSALTMSATRRKPIKGAAGRPIQFKYDDLVTQARLVEQSKLASGKGSARKRVPVYLQVAMFAVIAFFVLVFLTMENNPENPFHPYVEKQEVQLPH